MNCWLDAEKVRYVTTGYQGVVAEFPTSIVRMGPECEPEPLCVRVVISPDGSMRTIWCPGKRFHEIGRRAIKIWYVLTGKDKYEVLLA